MTVSEFGKHRIWHRKAWLVCISADCFLPLLGLQGLVLLCWWRRIKARNDKSWRRLSIEVDYKFNCKAINICSSSQIIENLSCLGFPLLAFPSATTLTSPIPHSHFSPCLFCTARFPSPLYFPPSLLLFPFWEIAALRLLSPSRNFLICTQARM